LRRFPFCLSMKRPRMGNVGSNFRLLLCFSGREWAAATNVLTLTMALMLTFTLIQTQSQSRPEPQSLSLPQANSLDTGTATDSEPGTECLDQPRDDHVVVQFLVVRRVVYCNDASSTFSFITCSHLCEQYVLASV
jgi:hypothetical protein